MFDRSVTETYIVPVPGLTLDQVVWRRYRRRTPGLTEAIVDMNYGLAALMEPFLPVGTVLTMPIDRPASAAQVARVKLW